MATRAQAERVLARRGLELAECAGKQADGSWHATVDAVGRSSIDGVDCRGVVVYNYTCDAAQFWQEVIDETDGFKPEPCPHPVGECDFHDFNDD